MSIRELFYKKIEEEHEDFLEMIDGYDTEEIVDNAEYIAKFQSIYKYLCEYEPLNGEQMSHFLKVTNPIELIAEKYSPLKAELHEEYLVACESITRNKLYAIGCSKKVDKLLERMGDEIGRKQKESMISQQERNIFDYMIRISSKITNHLADSLMQFENPIEVVQAATRNSPSLKDVANETIAYIENNDVFTLPHKIDHQKLLDESRWRHEVINEITSIIPRPDFKVTMSWIDFFRTLGDNAETFTENPYVDYINALHKISENQGDVILQQLYDMEKDALLSEDELIEAAKYLADGGDYNEIPELADNNMFEEPYENSKEKFADWKQQGGMDLC